jgi:3'-phosphoadenosine 5'-phosphosulfate sulfotransferase (PAPS reductase)/FAD synthetase
MKSWMNINSHTAIACNQNTNQMDLTVLSYGMGQDSTALFLKYIYDRDFRRKYAPGDFVVAASDTGDEHPFTYEYQEYIRLIAQEQDIPYTFITPDHGYHPPSWQSLMGKFYRNDSVMGKGLPQSCTDGLKIQPFYNWLADYVNQHYMNGMSRAYGKVSIKEYAQRYGRIKVMLGLAYQENRLDPGWREKETKKWLRDSIDKICPLEDLYMDRKACQEYIRSLGHPVPYPSNCMRCHWMRKQEVLWLYRNHPDKWFEWVDREQAKINRCAERFEKGEIKQNAGVFGAKLLPEILAEAEQAFGHWTDQQLDEYKFSHGHCVGSRY